MKKTKSFQEYIENRLDKEKIAEIERQVELEVNILKSVQKPISQAKATEVLAQFSEKSKN